MLDLKEVVDCIEALDKVAAMQSDRMARIEKEAADTAAELDRALDILKARSVDEYLSKISRESARPPLPVLGAADPKHQTRPKGMRESEYRLRRHFGLA